MNTEQITVYTMIHTGTHFCMEFLQYMDMSHDQFVSSPNTFAKMHSRVREPNPNEDRLLTGKVLTMARHPYLGAFRWLKNKHSRMTMDRFAAMWDVFLDTTPTIDCYIIDIACPKEKRIEVLTGAALHIGKDVEKYRTEIQTYATNWQPKNTTDSSAKQAYNKTGELPSGHDFTKLDRAVEWYNSIR